MRSASERSRAKSLWAPAAIVFRGVTLGCRSAKPRVVSRLGNVGSGHFQLREITPVKALKKSVGPHVQHAPHQIPQSLARLGVKQFPEKRTRRAAKMLGKHQVIRLLVLEHLRERRFGNVKTCELLRASVN